jgi:hypothetical protein
LSRASLVNKTASACSASKGGGAPLSAVRWNDFFGEPGESGPESWRPSWACGLSGPANSGSTAAVTRVKASERVSTCQRLPAYLIGAKISPTNHPLGTKNRIQRSQIRKFRDTNSLQSPAMPVLKKASGNPEGPSQYKQPSRKGKKAWRKNVDVTEVEKGLEEVNEKVIRG